jgi:multidrug efflux pump subunit AcrB
MKKAIAFFVRFSIWGDVLLLLLCGIGLLSFFKLNANFFPELEQRNVQVQVVYPGASPEEMENGVVNKVEDALKGIEGIEQITSVSSENIATIVVEGKKGYDPEVLLSDVKNTVDRISSFPTDAEKPVVFKVKQIERVVSMLLQGNVDLLTLKKRAEMIEDDLLTSGKVSQVELSGFPELEISVEVSEDNLKRYSMRFDDLTAAIRTYNFDLSGGSLKSNEEEVLLRFRNKKYTAYEIGAIPLRTNADGSIIRIADVAMVKEQFAESPNKTTLNGTNAVTIQVNKTVDEDIIEISDFARAYTETFNEQNEQVKISIGSDRSKVIRQRIELLVKNGITGFVLVVLVLGVFMNFRLAFWVAFSIPVAFLGMFIVAYFSGITINVISLFGMILVVGILVDDGIVIGENIYAHYESGKSAFNAAVDGTGEVITSVFASVSTTVVMFIPFFFLESRIGEAFSNMAIVVIACLVVSLLEGAFILPSHLAHSKALSRDKKTRLRTAIDKGIENFRRNYYGVFIQWLLTYRYIVLSLAVAFVLLTIGMMQGTFIKTTFFPFVDGDEISIDLTMKPGTRETRTEEVLQMLEAKVWEVNKEFSANRADGLQVIRNVRMEVGTGGTEKGLLDIELLDGESRNLESFKITNRVRELTGEIIDADKLTFGTRQIFGKPVSVSLIAKDLTVLESARKMAIQEFGSFPNLRDVTDNNQAGKREVEFSLKPLAYFLGLTTNDIARQIRQGFFGDEVQRLQIGQDEVKVWVRYPEAGRRTLGQMEQLRVKTQDGREFPLTELAELRIERGIVSINHVDGAREIKIEADLANPNEPVPPLIERIKNEVVPRLLAAHPGLRVKFEGQDKQNQLFQRSAGRAFPIALAVLVLIIVLTFRSWSQMFIILIMVPLGVFGALMGHWIEGKPVSIFSYFGMIALAGVVVNDSVVFIDKFNNLLRGGKPFGEAVVQAGISRFRAILLTSLTTVAGLYPLILEKSRQAQFLIPMAISVAWGLVFVTIFTLLLLPNLLYIFNDLRVWWHGKNNQGQWPLRESVEPAVQELAERTHA